MYSRQKRYLAYLIMGIIATLIATILSRNESKNQTHPRDYEEIERSGILKVVTEYNSLSYFVDGDTISGFQYELIKAFAHDKGLKMKITPEMSFEKRLEGLNHGVYDIIAYNILVTSELKDTIALTRPIILNKQILVQRKGDNKDSTYISNQLELAHKTLNVIKGSPSILRIRNLSNEIGDTIYVNEIDKYGSEQLLAMVAHGDIDYAVCDESIAKACIDSLPQLDINTDISFTQFYAWGISKQSPALLDTLNNWLKNYTATKEYKKLYKKYYKD